MIDAYELQVGQSTYPLFFEVIGEDGFSRVLGATPTVVLSKAGAGFASPAGEVTEIAYGVYQVAPNATDCGTLGPLLAYVTAPGALPRLFVYRIVAHDPYDGAGLGLTNLDAAVTSRSSHSAADVWASVARTLTASSDPSAAAIADAVWDEAMAGHVAAGSAGKALADILQVEQGKWSIDKAAGTLTLYAADGTTPLFAFTLLDDAAESTRTPL